MSVFFDLELEKNQVSEHFTPIQVIFYKRWRQEGT